LHNLNWFRGEVNSIVNVTFDAVTSRMVDMAIEFGQWECFKTLASHFGEHFRTYKYYDLATDKNKYPFPEDIYKFVGAERYDLDDDELTELSIGDFNQRNLDSTERMLVPLSNEEFALWPAPEAALSNGLRVFYKRRPKKMVNGNDVCELPEEYHYFVVFKAVDNLLLKPNIQVSNQQKYEMTRVEYQKLMTDTIKPIDEVGCTSIVDNDPY